MIETVQESVGGPIDLRAQVMPAAQGRAGHARLAMRRFIGPFRLSAQERAALTPEEQARLAAATRPDKVHRALAARLQLRRMLGQDLGCAPQDVRFVSTPDGKPLLHPVHGAAARRPDVLLDFSASYTSEGYAVCVTRGVRVGVDLQGFTARQKQNFETLFGGSDQRRVQTTLAPHEIWTRMEAFGKLQGMGLAYGLQRLYRVAVDPRTADLPCRFTDIRFAQGVALSLCMTGSARIPVSIVSPERQAGL